MGKEFVSSGRSILLLTLAALTIPAAFLINRTVPNAYMDEEFHIRQVQHYCQGDFKHWDPMITTFPGLYIISLAYAGVLLPLMQLLALTPSMNDLCQPAVLRSVNIVFAFICALLFREIVLHFDPEKNMVRASLKALVLSLYPLHWFFSFLYYTELGSATAVMAMYLASLKHAYWSSALFAAISILLRQTNAVWTIFVLCVGVLDLLQNDLEFKRRVKVEHELRFSDGQNIDHISNTQKMWVEDKSHQEKVRRRQSAKDGTTISSEDSSNSMHTITERFGQGFVNEGIFPEMWTLIRSAWFRRNEVLWNFGPFLLVIVAFAGFVLHNGSIVVGDKSSHKVSPHFAQLLYCGLISAGFQAAIHLSPHNLSRLLVVLKTSSWKNSLVCTGTALATTFVAIHYYSSAHPYLLADNRHFVFYFWKDVLGRHWSAKYLFIPLYIFSWCSIIYDLGQKQKVLWVTSFCLAVVGVLVPAPLLEFRYYNVPFYFMFLHSHQKVPNENYTLQLVALQFMVVNIVTVYIFLGWPFEWQNEPGRVQRFMW